MDRRPQPAVSSTECRPPRGPAPRRPFPARSRRTPDTRAGRTSTAARRTSPARAPARPRIPRRPEPGGRRARSPRRPRFPSTSTTSERAPRAAPSVASPSASALTSLSTTTGRPTRAPSSAARARPSSCGHLSHRPPDDTAIRVDRASHADSNGPDRAGRTAGLLGRFGDERDDRLEGIARAGVGGRARVRDHVAVSGDDADRRRRAADVHTQDPRRPSAAARGGAHRLEIAEVAECDAEARGRATRGRGAETDHLRLALASIAAVRERVVAPAGMRHELGHA